MAKKKGLTPVKKILIVGGVLAALQVAYLFIFADNSPPLKPRDAIKQAVAKQGKNLPTERRKQLEVQLAIQDFMIKNNNQPPKDLKALVPAYFDSEPTDPATGKVFAYKVDGGKFTLGSTGGAKAAAAKTQGIEGEFSTEERVALIASLKDPLLTEDYVYDPVGKRDPFRPYTVTRVQSGDKTELETYDLGQLKLTAIITDANQNPTAAIVESAVGKGYTVRAGTKIGINSGEVVEIKSDRLLILETSIDFTGKEETKTIEMRIRTKDQDARGKR